MYLLLDEEIKKLIFKESQIVRVTSLHQGKREYAMNNVYCNL